MESIEVYRLDEFESKVKSLSLGQHIFTGTAFVIVDVMEDGVRVMCNKNDRRAMFRANSLDELDIAKVLKFAN